LKPGLKILLANTRVRYAVIDSPLARAAIPHWSS
jgi:hypothetical protein